MGFWKEVVSAIKSSAQDDDDDTYQYCSDDDQNDNEPPTFAELDTGYMQEIGPSTSSPNYDTFTFDGKGVNYQDVDDPDEIEDPEGYWNWKMGGSDR